MAEEYLTRPVKSRARRYRERLQDAGYRQVAVWLDSDAYYLLRHFMATHKADAAAVISAVIKHCAAVPSDKLIVTRDVPSDTAVVTRDVPSDTAVVTRDVPSDTAVVTRDVPSDNQNVTRNVSAKGSRYMPPALEDRILALRQSGLSLSATARELATESYFNTKGAPYSTATVSKAEARARARQTLQKRSNEP